MNLIESWFRIFLKTTINVMIIENSWMNLASKDFWKICKSQKFNCKTLQRNHKTIHLIPSLNNKSHFISLKEPQIWNYLLKIRWLMMSGLALKLYRLIIYLTIKMISNWFRNLRFLTIQDLTVGLTKSRNRW